MGYHAPKPNRYAFASTETEANPLLLLVDDEAQVRQVVQRQLERLGYQVIAAPNGRAGLACLGNGYTPRLALLDMTLPDIDGAELARLTLEQAPGIAVVLMSGYRPEQFASQLQNLAIAGFLQKPFSLAELRAVLAAALAERS